jgi:SAM-dependent methyltransferase
MEVAKNWETGMLGYDNELKAIVASYSNAAILELGAGRRPSFTLDEMPSTVGSYTVNDISADELALLPPGYELACFDVSGDAENFRDSYDVVFSRFLAEHVPDGRAMHRNVHRVLRDGGVAFHLIPTLYCLPFVINKYMPERLTSWVLDSLDPRNRTSPKFPASYSLCYGDPERMRRELLAVGYRKVEIQNFYGHFYYGKIPVLRNLHSAFSDLAAARDWTWLSSYAYIRAYK